MNNIDYLRNIYNGVPSYRYSSKFRTSEIQLKSFNSIKPEKTTWLVNNMIAGGSLTILAGQPGVGKSTLAYTIAANTSNVNDDNKFFAEQTGYGHVIIISTEDSYARVISPRLQAANANLDNVHLIKKKYDWSNESLMHGSVKDDLVLFDESLTAKTGSGIALIIIDPISCIFGGDAENEKNVRASLEAISNLAEKLKCAIIGITHTSKSVKGKEPLARVASAKAITQVARTVLLIIKNENHDNIVGDFVLVKAKSNIATMNDGISYRIVSASVQFTNEETITTSKIERCDQLEGSAMDIIEKAERPAKRVNKVMAAQQFLMRELGKSDRLSCEIDELADEYGISKATLTRAKKLINIQSEKRTGNKTWLFLRQNN